MPTLSPKSDTLVSLGSFLVLRLSLQLLQNLAGSALAERGKREQDQKALLLYTSVYFPILKEKRTPRL